MATVGSHPEDINKEMIAEEDPDGDGVITKEEFIKMLHKKESS